MLFLGTSRWPYTKPRTTITIRTGRRRKGDVQSQFKLGMMYNGDPSYTADYCEAARWLRLAAEWGLGDARYELGQPYFRGRGVERDVALADSVEASAAKRRVRN